MRKLLPILNPYRVQIIIALVLMLIELMVELFQPLLIGKIIDEGIEMGDLEVVLVWGAVLVGFSLLAFVSGVTNSFYAAHVSQGFGYDTREKLFSRTLSAPYEQISRFATSSLMTRMSNDVLQLQNVLFMVLRIMLRAPLLVIGGVMMAFIIHPQLALVFAVVVPILVVALVVIMGRAAERFRKVQAQLDRVNGILQENLAGMRLVKAFLRRKHEIGRFARANDELVDRTVRALRTTEKAMPLILLVMNFSVVAVLWFGHLHLQIGSATIGDVVAIINYAFRITMSMSMVSMIIMILSRARASAGRIAEVLDLKEPEHDASDRVGSALKEEGNGLAPSALNKGERLSIRGSLAFRNVSFSYPGTQVPVLSRVTFDVHAGETVAVLGATGSGKSSLVQLISRLYEPDQGEIRVENHDIRTLDSELLRRHIGYVPQEVLLFSGSIRDNIAWGKPDATIEEIREAARAAQIDETIMALPQGYDTILGQKGVNLSGGQKQRVSIARALVRRPKILILDDCTSALDATTESRLLAALRPYDCTTLMITQKVSATMRADRILILEHGELAANGTHEQLIRRSALYRKICESQHESEGA